MLKPSALFSIDTRDITLVRAQLAAFSKQVPLLYFVLCINAVFCAVGFANQAPAWLAIYIPGVLVSLCLMRTMIWLRTRHVELTDAQARRRLRGVVWLGAAFGLVFLTWFLTLYRTATVPESRLLVIFAVVFTAISCMTCLLHLRSAARMVAFTIVLPFSLFLLSVGDPYLTVIGINQLLVIGAVVYVLDVASRDFDRMIQLSSENARLANIDSLTGLANRRLFFENLELALRNRSRSRRPFAVGVLDIDGFKAVNDLFGNVTGDRLLIEAGRRLIAVGGHRVEVARLGGDEFAVIVADARDPAELLAFGEKICETLRQPFALPGANAKVSASVGFAVHPVAGETAELLYERADYALYIAKHRKRGQTVIFSEEHESEIRNQSTLDQALRTADLENELSLQFQPLVDIDSDEPTAFEALARWKSPELGPVPPGLFIPVAERSELIFRITHILLRKALAAAQTWPDHIRISFNLSMRDIASPESIVEIQNIVRASGVAPRRIEFEITESALMGDFAQALASVTALRELGVRIALDDFGTGYSSLSHVHRLPLDKIKVDRSFLVDIESKGSTRDILKTVIDLCDNLNIACVVEGTETARQTEIVRELGCHSMQGYFFARPMPLADIPAFLATRRSGGVAKASSGTAVKPVASAAVRPASGAASKAEAEGERPSVPVEAT